MGSSVVRLLATTLTLREPELRVFDTVQRTYHCRPPWRGHTCVAIEARTSADGSCVLTVRGRNADGSSTTLDVDPARAVGGTGTAADMEAVFADLGYVLRSDA